MTQRILVLGCGDVGSTVAHRLFLHGADVALADVGAPAHPRRGMAFTDAWFDGTATLEAVVALLILDVAALASTLEDMDAIAGTFALPGELVSVWRPDALVDARMRKRAVPEDLRALAPVVLGLGPGFAPGTNCSIAIETAWGDRLGDVLRDVPASALAGEPHALGGAGRERFVYAVEAGAWCTSAHIGDRVVSGALVGRLCGMPVHAPLAGVLRGLTRNGVTVRAGQKLVEVDPSVQAEARGLGARPSVIARGVARALGFPTNLDDAFFGFESEFKATLDCMPMSLRLKLDRCGLKLSLEQWRALPRPLRETLLETPVDEPRRIARMSRFLRRRAEQLGWPELPRLQGDDNAVDTPHAVPLDVVARCAADGGPSPSAERWATLAPMQRYALLKLARNQSGRNWCAALAEFNLVDA